MNTNCTVSKIRMHTNVQICMLNNANKAGAEVRNAGAKRIPRQSFGCNMTIYYAMCNVLK